MDHGVVTRQCFLTIYSFLVTLGFSLSVHLGDYAKQMEMEWLWNRVESLVAMKYMKAAEVLEIACFSKTNFKFWFYEVTLK